jgi:hypothetical protein
MLHMHRLPIYESLLAGLSFLLRPLGRGKLSLQAKAAEQGLET